MERLTCRVDNYVHSGIIKRTAKNGRVYESVAGNKQIRNKLCAYEDTGLSPECVAELARRANAVLPKNIKGEHGLVGNCPTDECNAFVCSYTHKYCQKCGQKLLWKVKEEKKGNAD